MASTSTNDANSHSLTNYCSYVDRESQTERIGHLSEDRKSLQPLAFRSGTPIKNLCEVIEAGEANIIPYEDPLEASSVKLLPPINGRDVLCVGKNYGAHATEFNKSGYDSSDKVDQPTHPVIFTKRFTSIIADGEEIHPHPDFTETLDYEGELAVIIGKPGFRISEKDAMDHVWGYTICNDVTARERQRDHKQFYIGKSADTFCPLGPVAVPANRLPKVFRVQTHVNGEPRQDATTEDLIFSIPYLIMTLSEGQTLMPGDVLATGTPAGVGFGQNPPNYLKPGDEVIISITGLRSLTNRIASKDSRNPVAQRIMQKHTTEVANVARTPVGAGLTTINNKPLHYIRSGRQDGPPIIFIHGLGATMDHWAPLIETAELRASHSLHLFDFEGHGLSPTSPLHELSIESFADDLKGIFDHAGISSGATIVAHSMGCLVAVEFALQYPNAVSKLILLGPLPSPFPEDGARRNHQRAALARSKGMSAVANTVVPTGTLTTFRKSNPLGLMVIRLSLLRHDPEGYAKACSALANATKRLDFSQIQAHTSIITGEEDVLSPPDLCRRYTEQISKPGDLTVLQGVDHWHALEDPSGVAKAVTQAL